MGSSGVITELQRNSNSWTKVMDEIAKMDREIFPKDESLIIVSDFDKESKKNNSGLLYIEKDGQVVGYVMYCWPSSFIASINNLAVKESDRRQGHGEALLKGAIEKCRTRKVFRIYLTFDPTNTAAMNLYKKFGFQVDGLIHGYYSPDSHAYRMYCILNQTGC